MLACFATHVLSVLRRGYFCPLNPLYCNGIYAVILICRGQPPLRVMLACWSVVLIGLSHFLHFTYLLAFAVFIQSLRSFYSLLFFTHTAPPTPHKRCSSFALFVSVPYTSFTLFVQPLLCPPATFKQKDAPTLLPAAPCHSTSCYPCQGHSLHSRRLAHNAQAYYSISLHFISHISLAIHASSRLFYL